MKKFGSLWVGGPLKKLQETCLASFVYYGHDITLWVYDLDLKVPTGVKKKDARELIPEENIFLVRETYAAFSDVFRYKMVDKFDMIWVDADTLCCSEDWNFFKDDILLSTENGVQKDYFVGGVLSLPTDSLITNYLVRKSEKINPESVKWAEVGPILLSNAIKSFDYEHYAQPPNVLCMIEMQEAYKFWSRKHAREIILRTREEQTKSASLYNGMLTIFARQNINTNKIPMGSAMEYFYNKFVLGKIK